MSERLDRLLDMNLARAARAFDHARSTHATVRNGLLGLGFSAAVFLPLASSEPTVPPDPVPPSVVRNELHVHPETIVSGGATQTPSPTVHVDVVSYEIQFAPPMTRDWHRTTFSQNGDEFWALPDANFVMRFTRGPAWAAGCFRETCNGVFSFRSERYLGTTAALDSAWTTSGRDIASSDALTGCRVISADVLTPITSCRFVSVDRSEEVMNQTSGNPDLCIWMRRSDHLEQQNETETVALDVRWARFDHLQGTDCPDLYK